MNRGVVAQPSRNGSTHKRFNPNVDRPISWQPPKLNTTSRCTVDDVSLHYPSSGEPPDFPEGPLAYHWGILSELPPSMLQDFLDGKYADSLPATGQQQPPPPPQADPVAPGQLPVDHAAAVAGADRQLLAQLNEVCLKQTQHAGRPSALATILPTKDSSQALIKHCLGTSRRPRTTLAHSLLALAEWSQPPRAKRFLLSLFMAMRRMPKHEQRESFIEMLCPPLSPELKAREEEIKRYWVDACTSGYCQADTQEFARRVCACFGWPVPD